MIKWTSSRRLWDYTKRSVCARVVSSVQTIQKNEFPNKILKIRQVDTGVLYLNWSAFVLFGQFRRFGQTNRQTNGIGKDYLETYKTFCLASVTLCKVVLKTTNWAMHFDLIRIIDKHHKSVFFLVRCQANFQLINRHCEVTNNNKFVNFLLYSALCSDEPNRIVCIGKWCPVSRDTRTAHSLQFALIGLGLSIHPNIFRRTPLLALMPYYIVSGTISVLNPNYCTHSPTVLGLLYGCDKYH